jgi:gas vesicle protein
MEKIGKFLLGAVIGGLFAAAIVILITPAPGSQLRQQVTGRVASIRDEVQKAAETRRKELEAQLDQLQHPQK